VKPTALVLVKHALPVLDPSRAPREWRLGSEGELQARRLARRLRAFVPLRLVASPEPKAWRTGELVAAELGLAVSEVEGVRELDRPVSPLLSQADHERANEGIFADLDRRFPGAESARNALDRFSAAVRAELVQTRAQTLVVITHGLVISLFVGAHNDIDAFELWRTLACPAFVVLNAGPFALREVVADAA